MITEAGLDVDIQVDGGITKKPSIKYWMQVPIFWLPDLLSLAEILEKMSVA